MIPSNFNSRMTHAVCDRFNEISMPPQLAELPKEDLENFFEHRGWLVLVRRPKAMFIRVVMPPRKDSK